MIKSDNGKSVVSGMHIEIMNDSVAIMQNMLHNSPEIVLALFKVYTDDLKDAVERCNTSYLRTAEAIIAGIKEINKE